MAAIVLKQLNPGYIERHGVGADALDKTIDALRVRHNSTPLQGASLFRTAKAVGGVYEEGQYGTKLPLPRENEDSADLPFVTPWKGFKKEFTIQNYRSAVQVERAFTEDQLIDIARKLMSGLMQSAKLLLEYQFADIFNNLTASSGYDGADGVCPANASHPFERRAYGTWSNVETTAALSSFTFFTARKNLRKRKDEWGYPNPIVGKTLLIPPDLEGTAKEIAAAEKVPENALNTPNVWRNSFDIMVWDYLTSTTQWCLIGDVPAEDKSFVYVEGAAPNIAPCEGADKSTDIIWGERLRMRFAVGAMVARELSFNAGA